MAGGDSDEGPTDPGSVALGPLFPTRLRESSPDPRDWGTEMLMNSWLVEVQTAGDWMLSEWGSRPASPW